MKLMCNQELAPYYLNFLASSGHVSFSIMARQESRDLKFVCHVIDILTKRSECEKTYLQPSYCYLNLISGPFNTAFIQVMLCYLYKCNASFTSQAVFSSFVVFWTLNSLVQNLDIFVLYVIKSLLQLSSLKTCLLCLLLKSLLLAIYVKRRSIRRLRRKGLLYKK